MSDAIDEAIALSRASLVLRDPSHPFQWSGQPLPDDVRAFFEQVAGGTLLAKTFDDGIAIGFELEPDALMMSINQYFGIPPGDPTFAHCDQCFVFAHHVSDPESAWGFDLNTATSGRVFACRIALGQHPQHEAIVVAENFDSWLRFWIDNYRNAAGDWRKLAPEPQLARLV